MEHTLEHPQEVTGGGDKRWSSCARACGAWSSRCWRNIHGDGQRGRSLWFDVSDLNVLHKVYAHLFSNHHHNLRGIAIAAERSLGDVENLNQDIVKDSEGLEDKQAGSYMNNIFAFLRIT
jgi:hypothetical protein